MQLSEMDFEQLFIGTANVCYRLYNGIVNKNDPYTRLIFIRGVLPDGVLANSTAFGFIRISLPNITDYCIKNGIRNNVDKIKNLAFEIIIHELTHMDQLIDNKMMDRIPAYREEVEDQCINQTIAYILNNKKEHESYLKFPIDEEYIRSKLVKINNNYSPKILNLIVPHKLQLLFSQNEISKFGDTIEMKINTDDNYIVIRDNGTWINSFDTNGLFERINQLDSVSPRFNSIEDVNGDKSLTRITIIPEGY